MTFSLTRPPSREGQIPAQGHDDDHLFSALHSALSGLVPGSSSHQDHHHDMTKEKEKAGIDIVVDSDTLSLQGTSVDVEPALLKGYIVLHLTEPTSIKEITLVFRGKAKLPIPSADSLTLGASPQWYTICHHEWSFLEGEKRHSHTLKAGYHQFPFQLQLGGSLPSSITSSVHGGAHVSYKLRAVAVRPGLAHNMQAVMPISIIRTFAAEALEYQQSLEIENTWPGKLMYSIMIPHKAWAAGDDVTAVVKFSPLSKGVRVLTVATTINETTRLPCRNGVQEHTRAVVTALHEIHNGNAIPLMDPYASTREPSVGLSSEDRSHSFGSLAASLNDDLTLRQVPSTASSSSSSSSSSCSSSPSLRFHSGPASPLIENEHPTINAEPIAQTSSSTAEQDVHMSQDDVVAQLNVYIPKSVTPSHSLDPITVTHRIRWSILMSNLDGHTSELRCSLPMHILDARLLDAARANSAATRRLLLGGPEAPIEEEHDSELPSYSAHVRDRVANMYLPDSATTRVPNPWVHSNITPTLMPEHQSLAGALSPSGAASPLMPHPVSSHLPHVPQTGASMPLEWVNSELLLSISNPAPIRTRANTSPHSHSPFDLSAHSRPESRLVSRRGSRAPSPERHLTMTTLGSPTAPLVSAATPALTLPHLIPASHETFVHNGHASRSLPGLFSIQLKPYLSLTPPGWLSSRSSSHSNLTSLPEGGHGYRDRAQRPYLSTTMTMTPMPLPVPVAGPHAHGYAHGHTLTPSPVAAPESEGALWHRAFTEVPDYEVALQGFIGGVTPLTSMRGLPSYEEAERSAGEHGVGDNSGGGGEGDGLMI